MLLSHTGSERWKGIVGDLYSKYVVEFSLAFTNHDRMNSWAIILHSAGSDGFYFHIQTKAAFTVTDVSRMAREHSSFACYWQLALCIW